MTAPIAIGDRVHVRNVTVEGHNRSWQGEVTAVNGSIVKVTMPGLPRDHIGGWARIADVTLIAGTEPSYTQLPLLLAA